ncbi:MAG: 50S ribosomal protein L5 [Planctomycetota bacterium]|nr:MAG: 50S ribosomal protein L5 [Planctomycetota bacterium]
MAETETYEPRLMARYKEEIVPRMMERFKYKNPIAVPRLEKIVVSIGVGSRAKESPKRLEGALEEMALITGQRPVMTRAKMSVSNFRVRQGDPVGGMVTLRKKRMYEFLDRLISIAIPRIRDFRGLSRKSFDGRGNYALGLSEQIVFPEINVDKVENVQGMNIVIVTTARTDEEALELLALLGMPFVRL